MTAKGLSRDHSTGSHRCRVWDLEKVEVDAHVHCRGEGGEGERRRRERERARERGRERVGGEGREGISEEER